MRVPQQKKHTHIQQNHIKLPHTHTHMEAAPFNCRLLRIPLHTSAGAILNPISIPPYFIEKEREYLKMFSERACASDDRSM